MKIRNFALWLLTAFFAFDISAAVLKYGDIVTIRPARKKSEDNWYLTVRKDSDSDIRKVLTDVGGSEKWILVGSKQGSSGSTINNGDPVCLKSVSLDEYLYAINKPEEIKALGKNEVSTKKFDLAAFRERRKFVPKIFKWNVFFVGADSIVAFKSMYNKKFLRGGHGVYPHDTDLADKIGNNEKWILNKVGVDKQNIEETAVVTEVGPAEIQAPEVSAKFTLPAGFISLTPGGLEGVAVGLDAHGKPLILGRGEAGVIFRANIVKGKPVVWTKLAGRGEDIAVGSDGTMVRIYQGKPYIWGGRATAWDLLPDADLIKIAVGKDGDDLWAVTKEGALVHLEDNQWVSKKDGQIKYVAAASDGTVAYIDGNNNVFVSYDSGATFNQIKNLKLDMISVARRNVMRGIFRDNLYWLTVKGHWLLAKKGRNLENIAVGPDGTFVAISSIVAKKVSGAPYGNAIFYKKIKLPPLSRPVKSRPVKGPGATTPETEEVVSTSEIEETVIGSTTGFPSSFFEITGQPLRQVSLGVSADGTTAIWGVASDNKIYQGAYQPGSMGMGPTINWTENKAGLASRISVGRDIVLAVSPYNNVWRWNSEKGAWDKFSDQTGDFKMVAAADSNNIWALKENGSIVRWVDEKWDPVNGNAIFIDVSTDGNKVVALNSAGTPFFRNKAGTDWEPLGQPQVFKEIYIGSDELIRGISSDGHWMIFENRSWTKSPITQLIMSGDIDAKSDVAVVTPENKVYFRQGTVAVAVATEVVATPVGGGTLAERIDTAVAEAAPLMRIQKLKDAVIWAKENNATFPEAEAAAKQWEFVGRNIGELNTLLSSLPAVDPTLKAFYDLLIKVIAYEPLYGSQLGFIQGWMDALKAKGVVVPAIEPPAPDADFNDVLTSALARPSIDAQIESLGVIVNWVGSRILSFMEMGGFAFVLQELAAKIKAMPTENDEQKNAKNTLQTKYLEFLGSIKDKSNLLGLSGKATVERLITELPKAAVATPVVVAPAAAPSPVVAPAPGPRRRKTY